MKSGAHWFVKILKSKGVNFVFGTTGAGMPDIQDAMVVEKPPKWIQGLHEFTTISASAGYALASGKAGIAMIDRIVGTQNAVGAFYGAYLNSAPIVVFASRNVPGIVTPTGDIASHYMNHSADIISPWVKWFTYVESLDNLPEDIEKAFFLSLSEQKGPVYVSLRQDLMAQKVATGRLVQTENPHPSARVPADDVSEKIVDEILRHEAPCIVVTNVGRNANAVPILVRFAHIFGCSVHEGRDFMNYPRADSLHLGFVSPPRADVHTNARGTWPRLDSPTDLVLLIETGLTPHLRLDESVDVIDIASDPFRRQDVKSGGDYGSSLFPALIRVVADVGPTLEKLIKIGEQKISNRDKERIDNRIEKISLEHLKLKDSHRIRAMKSYQDDHLDAWSIGYVLNKYWPSDAIWVDGTFTLNSGLASTIDLNAPGTYFSNPSGHLGFAIGMAYGAALANRSYVDVTEKENYAVGRLSDPSHPVICTAGDGEAIMGNIPSALWTCGHYGIAVLYVLLNNRCWGMEWRYFERTSENWVTRSKDFEFLDLDEPTIDFAGIGRALKVHSESVDTVGQFENLLQSSLKQIKEGKPALIDVRLDKFTGRDPSVVP